MITSFAIDAGFIGSKEHFLSDGSWAKEIPEDYWIIGKNVPYNRDLLTALYLDGKSIKFEPPKQFVKMVRTFTYESDIPWQMVMPDHAYERYVKEASDNIYKAFESADLSYYENIYKPSCEVLSALQPMKIHKMRWQFLAEHDIQGVSESVIDSFEPNEDGFADKLEYSLTSTVSGRLIVTSGPEILRLNKEMKSIIKSRYKNGKIIQFDYVSLEPRLALIIAGHNVSHDIYADINAMVFGNQFPRDVVKISTLSVMYGAGAKSLSEKTNISVSDCRKIIQQLKEFFGIHALSKKLAKQFKKDKIIRNFFGRAIVPEDGASHKLYNHYIQSSAVDAAMLGFRNIIGLINGVVPLFVIHDNMGLDFPPEAITKENINKIKEAGSKIPILGSKLLLDSDNI